MCETMANIPVEEKSSYVLTEDMIDAAMNEQFAFQEDLESEGELSSIEDGILDQDPPESHLAEGVQIVDSNEQEGSTSYPNINTETVVNANSEPKVNIIKPSSPMTNNNKMSVLVIETGLDKNGTNNIKSSSKGNLVENAPDNITPGKNNQMLGDTSSSVDPYSKDNKSNLTILKSILSDEKDQNGVIDLCDSEGEDFSEEDDVNEAASIDDELKSVMETNLMAEIGMTLKEKTGTNSSLDKHTVEKVPEIVTPRISVKNIAHISTHTFDRIPQHNTGVNSRIHSENLVLKTKTSENQCLKNPVFGLRHPNNLNNPVIGNNQSPRPIHINKIAIPHSTFLNNQGQRMKCVFVKSTSNLPFVINKPTQTTATNTNLKYVFAQPMKKGSPQMPAITALKNLTKSVQPQTFGLIKNPKLLNVAQKLEKPIGKFQSIAPDPALKEKRDNLNSDIIKNVLKLNNTKPYSPSETFPENPTYTCVDCNDKFLFKMSLAHHIERRSLSIRYRCLVCKSTIQFYNRCALSLHLRGHNSSINEVDSSCITINPMSKDCITRGLIKTYFLDMDKDVNQPKKTFSKTINTNTSNSNSVDSKLKAAMSVVSSNLVNNKITTVAGQSKSVCYQTPSSSDISQPVSSAVVTNTQPPTKLLPLILPKPQTVQTVLNARKLSNQKKEQSATSNKSASKSLILFCNQLPQSQNTHHNSNITPIPPNVVCEADSTYLSTVTENNDTEMLVDDDVSVAPRVPDEEEIVDVENVDGNITSPNTPSVSNSETEKGSTDKGIKSPVISMPSIPKKRNCSECNTYCHNTSKHLNGTGRPNPYSADRLACKICNLILPTKCALKIHHRIHMKIPPYKCPDCGKDFTTWDDLHAHLKFSCGHFAKCVRFICTACKSHFPTKTGLEEHIIKKHSRHIFRCSLCPVAFYKESTMIDHIASDHPTEKDNSNVKRTGLDYKQCEMCPKKLLSEASYIMHSKEHTNTMIYGYKCSTCNVVFANKMAFIIHQIKEKTKKDREEKSGDFSKSVVNEELIEESVQVSDSNSDYEDEPVIIRKFPENNNDSSINEKDPLSLDDFEVTQEQKVKEETEELCIVCKKNSVVLLPGIDLNRQSLCCKQCVKPLDAGSTRESSKGYRITHAIAKSTRTKNVYVNVHKISNVDEVKNVPKKRRASDISNNSALVNDHPLDPFADSPSRKKSRKKQKDKLNIKTQTHIQGQVIKSKSPDDFCYKCSKCGFQSEKRDAFLEHITVHRSDPNTYQCLECGLCFVVLPSLERHLHMHHGIKDVSNYIANNKSSSPQKTVQMEEETQENQCRVCREIFDCKSSLDKHFRTHGMAYMSRFSKSP